MNNSIKVIHCAFEDQPLHVATVHTEDLTTMQALEYAFRWTQNIEDSWSNNGELDANDNVTVEAPLHKGKDGQLYGLRSTSVGDQMLVNELTYIVDSVGFKLLDPPD